MLSGSKYTSCFLNLRKVLFNTVAVSVGFCCVSLISNFSNFVTRLYEVEGVTAEITAVSEFMASLLGADCAGDKDLTFLTLRVGNQL